MPRSLPCPAARPPTPCAARTSAPSGANCIELGRRHVGRIAEDNIELPPAGKARQQIAFEKLDPLGHAVLLRIVAGHGQRRRTDVDGRHAAARQVLGQTDGDDAAARADIGDERLEIRDWGLGIGDWRRD